AADSTYPVLTKAKWRRFWTARIIPAARTIWWRALHNKVSCRAALHHILPDRFDSPLCALGDLALDSVDHFLFACSLKWEVWSQVLEDCLLVSVSLDTISKAIFSLDLPSWPIRNSPLSEVQLIAGVLLGVWRTHWSFIFSAVPFNSIVVSSSTHKLLLTFRQEETI
ncbi:hypothetical protein BDB00DRAFT_749041, partial [Zychaea mexicana]|uniref:uncharacterized protein n=1 Tax=Zychaea mexicana TaxID=64656 RepID=UPI0022FE452E